MPRPGLAAPLVASLLLVVGCAPLQRVLPSGPVLDVQARAGFDALLPSPATYTGEPLVAYPVLPLQVFGVRYAADIVLVTKHPDWDMHEYARIDTPSGPLWVAKDTNNDLVQTITANLDDIGSWVPEIPVPRIQRPMTVVDRSTPGIIDVDISYTNPAGDPVALSFSGKEAKKPPDERNGNTMGHSRQMAAVVLDLAGEQHGGKVKISIGGEPWGIEHMFGIWSMKYVLDQTQGGVVITRFRQGPDDNGFTLDRPGDDSDWPTHASERWTLTDGGRGLVLARQHNGLCGFTYAFLDGGLAWAEVTQVGVSEPVFRVAFRPALPDMRRPFEGTVTSQFAFDVHGQQGHGTGELRASWQDGAAVLDLVPTAPRWLTDRPMRTTIRYQDQAALVQTVRTN